LIVRAAIRRRGAIDRRRIEATFTKTTPTEPRALQARRRHSNKPFKEEPAMNHPGNERREHVAGPRIEAARHSHGYGVIRFEGNAA
jgi:hypothetical protein